jgi:putative peptide zinc metalloprotease protein
VHENSLARLAAGQPVEFVPALPESPAVHCAVEGIDRLNLAALDEPYVASVYGGGIASLRQPDGTLAPLDSTFRVRLGHCDHAVLPRELSGQAEIDAARSSLAGRFVRWLGALVQRESNF